MVLDQVIYDPFGNLVTETNASDGDRLKFAGMEYDSVTELYYDHARYYDSAIGRFVSQDSMSFKAGDANLYRYVFNDPTLQTDPTGDDVTFRTIDPGPGPGLTDYIWYWLGWGPDPDGPPLGGPPPGPGQGGPAPGGPAPGAPNPGGNPQGPPFDNRAPDEPPEEDLGPVITVPPNPANPPNPPKKKE